MQNYHHASFNNMFQIMYWRFRKKRIIIIKLMKKI